MTEPRNTEPAPTGSGALTDLPEWSTRTIAVLSTVDGEQPHAIPVSAPVRAGDRRILISLHHTRDSLRRLHGNPYVALVILTGDNIALTARGRAKVVQEPMTVAPEYVAVAIDVEQIDDHRQPGFVVDSGVGRKWLDETERDSLGQRVRALGELASRR